MQAVFLRFVKNMGSRDTLIVVMIIKQNYYI